MKLTAEQLQDLEIRRLDELAGKISSKLGKKVNAETARAVLGQLLVELKASGGYYIDDRWPYMRAGDDPQSCKMLGMNFDVEQHAGVVLHIRLDRSYKK